MKDQYQELLATGLYYIKGSGDRTVDPRGLGDPVPWVPDYFKINQI